MKKLLLIATLACAAFTFGPVVALADHDKDCKGVHGKVTKKSDTTITVDDKSYAMTAASKITKDGKAVELTKVKIGESVCLNTKEAADGSQQVASLLVLDKADADSTGKARVRGKVDDSDKSKDRDLNRDKNKETDPNK